MELLVKKIMLAAAGLVGALTIFVLWRPNILAKYRLFTAGLVCGGMGVGAAVFLSGFFGNYFGVSNDLESLSAISWVLGVVSVGILNLIANFFRKADDNHKDIKEVWDEIRK